MSVVFLRFSQGAPPYRAGEVAGFSAQEARAYLDRKVARQIERPDPAEIGETAPEEEPLVVVRFTEACPPYRAGELAGFSAERATQLVRDRFAERYGKASPSARPEPQAPPRMTEEPPAEGLVQVQFVKSGQGYRAGEVAGFEAEVAEKLIESGVAVVPGTAPRAVDGSGDPDPSKVDPDVEVVGLDDRDPDWRDKQKAALAAVADKMEHGRKRK